GREVLRLALNGLAEGAKNALSVGVACALVGVIIGVMTLTGAATMFAGYVIRLGEHSLFLSLFLTMLVCLVLGMGIPTIPNYIITSSLAAPALLELGVPLIVSHMFVFYFGIMADLTPPVALARAAAAVRARRAPGRLAHVLVLHCRLGPPGAPGRARARCGAAPRARVRAEDQPAGDPGRDRRLRRAVHGGLCAGADAAG